MKKHIHLFVYCLLSSMFFNAHAIQKVSGHEPNNNNILAQEADRAVAELSALTQDENAAEMRSLCGSSNCGKRNCGQNDCGCAPKNDCCTKLQCRRIITTLDIVESKVCLLTECEPIPLSQDDVVSTVLTIDQPGQYCLATDINGSINILASEVTLDMNCHQVTGSIALASSQDDVSVSNGVIDANSQEEHGVDALGNNSNIHLSRLTVRNSTSGGIRLNSSTNLFISDIFVENSAEVGVNVIAGNNILISDSVFFNNTQHGFEFTGNPSNNVILTNCQSISNGGDGFIITSASSEDIYFYSCAALQNSENGFNGGSARWSTFDCVADGNTENGFRANDSTAYFERCVAQNNTDNGFIAAGSDTSGTMNQCIALNNSDDGFNDTVGSSVRYTSNYATGNGTNYNPAAGPPFNPFLATDAGLSFWYNTLSP